MKRALLAGAFALAAMAAAPRPAHALFGVGDVVICTNCTSELAELARQAETIAQWGQQAQQMAQRIQQAKAQLDALTGVRDLGSAEGSTVWVLIRRLNSSCNRSIAFVVQIGRAHV
mgnify:CR=1 FL=1